MVSHWRPVQLAQAAALAALLVLPHPQAFAQSRAYTASPGDVLQVTVYGNASLSGQFPVDVDGAITFPMIGSVTVAGKTMAEIGALLEKPLAEHVAGATVAASVSRYAPVFILGDVQTPGKYEYRPGMIALELVAMAGGLGRVDKKVDEGALRLIDLRQDYADLDIQIFAMRVKRLRVAAELEGKDFVVDDASAADPDVQGARQRVIDGERRLYAIRSDSLKANQEALKAQEQSYVQEIATLSQSITLHDQEIALLEQDVEAARKLAEKALTSQSNFRQSERQLSATRRDALEMQTYLARAEQNRLVVEQQRETLVQQRQNEAAADLQTIDLELARMTRRQQTVMATMAQIAAGADAGPDDAGANDAVLSIMRPSDKGYSNVIASTTAELKPGDILTVKFALARPGRQARAE